jgi:hypothetical protein
MVSMPHIFKHKLKKIEDWVASAILSSIK